MASNLTTALSSKRRRILAFIAVPIVLIGIAIGVYFGYRSFEYVITDNARITAPLINVAPQTSCQIITLNADLGNYLRQGQSVAEVGQPRAFDPDNRQGTKSEPIGNYGIEAPVSGYVAAVWTYPGAVVSAGQSIITIYDSSNVWVSANIDETKIDRIKPGQAVEITVDSLGGASLKGTVEGIAPVTAGTFSLLPQQNTSGNFIKVVQVVPVKISIQNDQHTLLIPGTSVEVKINTR